MICSDFKHDLSGASDMATRFSAVLAIFLGLTFVLPQAAEAGRLDGRWAGAGYFNTVNGQRERVRCKVSYSRKSTNIYAVNATCASPSAQIRQRGTLQQVSSGRYSGTMYNTDYNVGGSVFVKVNGRSQTVSFSSDAGSGRLNLRKR
jgi:hypothetical protein